MAQLVVQFIESFSEDQGNTRVYCVNPDTSIGKIIAIVQENTRDPVAVQQLAQRIVAKRKVGALSMTICCGPFQPRE